MEPPTVLEWWPERLLCRYAASAIRNGHELQLILLHSVNKWADAKTLFDFGFEQFRREGNGTPPN